MFNRYEYMRAVTVASVGGGGITDENGRFLRMIGNLPVKAGDRVWTDGRIVYGHVPVRQNVNLANKILGVPYFFNETVKYMILTPQGNELNKKNLRVGRMFNWMYSDKNAVYSGTADSPGLKDFLDVKVTGNAVYTAEYLPNDAPFYGRGATGWGGAGRRLVFFVANVFLHCDDNNVLHPSFSIAWSEGGRLYSNPIIAIKRSGSIIGQIKLSDYVDYVLKTLEETYLQYDEYDAEDDSKEIYHHCDAIIGGHKYLNLDIWISYINIQCVNFSFVDNSGNWEMTLCIVGEGQVYPHTSDREPEVDEETGQPIIDPDTGKPRIIDVWSFFAVAMPVIYYVVKVTSTRKMSVYQRKIIAKPLPGNGLAKEGFHDSWTNAKAMEIDEVNESETPAFWVNYGDYSMKTNLAQIQSIISAEGTLISGARMVASQRLTLSDASEATSYGAINKYITTNLQTGGIQKEEGVPKAFGYNTGTKYGPTHYLAGNIIYPTQYAPLYFGRVSFYKFADNDYTVALRWQEIWRVKNGTVVEYSGKGAPINVNQDIVNLRRAMKKPKNITDLIADVTAGKLSKNNQQGG